jgi:hypothetical protein
MKIMTIARAATVPIAEISRPGIPDAPVVKAVREKGVT